MTDSDTIFALSSGAMPSGLAIIRISGSQAQHILVSLTGKLPVVRKATVALLREGSSGDVIDEAVTLWMPAPNSATGEDMAEMHCHGSVAVISRLFEIFRTFPATRMAEAGEFSRRAFHNEKMDLLAVEGLADLLQAQTEAQRRLAIRHYSGAAASVYEGWRQQLLAILARIEAAIDFVDDGDIAELAMADVRLRTVDLIQVFEQALQHSSRAASLRDGIKIVIAGPPNAGKSSLLNWLAARDAAIVSAIAGTTRDVIEIRLVLNGMPVLLTDTAGLRQSAADEIEQIGIARSHSEIHNADIVLWMTEADAQLPPPATEAPTILVVNKCDLLPRDTIHLRNDEANGHIRQSIAVSVKTGFGLPELTAQLEWLVRERFSQAESAVVVRERHKAIMTELIRLLNESLDEDTQHLELAAEAVRKAAVELGYITGRIGVEDMLGKIFSDFCIGK